MTASALSDHHVRAQLDAARSLLPSIADIELARGVDELLARGEFQLALNALNDLGETLTAPESFWSLLVESAETIGLVARAQTFRWRRIEARSGYVRASLHVHATAHGSEVTSGQRARWNIHDSSEGTARPLADGAITIEGASSIAPGATRTIRLHPLVQTLWRHVRAEQTLPMFDGSRLLGRAVVLGVVPPFVSRQ